MKQSVIVKDTKAPEFVLPANMELLQGTGLDTFDYNSLKSLMKISDLSEISIEIDTSKIDINTPGQYDFNVTVKDKYNNETKKTGKVTVIAKPVISNNEEVVHETVKNKDGSTSVKTKVQKNRVLIQIELLIVLLPTTAILLETVILQVVLLQKTPITILLETTILQVVHHQKLIKDH